MSKRLNLKRRTVATAVVSVLIGLLIGFSYSALAQSPTLSTATITGGPAPGAPSWTIFTEGGYYYGKDDNGNVLGPSTNASYIINLAIENGETIQLNPFDATLSAPIKYKNNTQIIGSGEGQTILRYSAANFAIQPYAATLKQNVHLEKFQIILTSDTAGLGGINFDGVTFSEIKDVKIWSSAATKTNTIGIKLTDTASVGAYFNTIENPNISNMNKAIYLEDNAWTANVNTVKGGRLSGCVSGFYLADGVNNWIYSTDFEGNTVGIYCAGLMNSVNGAYFESNTLDINLTSTGSLSVIGTRRDITITDSGDLIFLGLGYSISGVDHNTMQGIPTGATITFVNSPTGFTWGNPGAAYIDVGANAETRVDLTFWRPTQSRIVVTASGDEAGSGKGLRVALLDNTEICKVEWNGVDVQHALAGNWTDLPIELADYALYLEVKGSSGSEDITMYQAQIQFR